MSRKRGWSRVRVGPLCPKCGGLINYTPKRRYSRLVNEPVYWVCLVCGYKEEIR